MLETDSNPDPGSGKALALALLALLDSSGYIPVSISTQSLCGHPVPAYSLPSELSPSLPCLLGPTSIHPTKRASHGRHFPRLLAPSFCSLDSAHLHIPSDQHVPHSSPPPPGHCFAPPCSIPLPLKFLLSFPSLFLHS